MKPINFISITAIIILMFFPVFSFASFPIPSDTIQIQKETLEEYQKRIKKQGVLTKKNSDYEDSKIVKKWKSKSIFQKLLLIIALLLFLLFQLIKNADWSWDFDFRDPS